MDPRDLPPEIRHLPIDPRRGLPVPFLVEQPPQMATANFGVLDPHRAQACYANRLCAMCGLKMGAEVALYGDVVSLDPGGFFIEAPTHERCIELALGGLCPFISRETYPRRRIDDPDVMILGDRDALPTIGRTVPKRPAFVAIARRYTMAAVWSEAGQMPVYLAQDVIRTRQFAWVEGVATEVLRREVAAEPAPPERPVVRRQPRRTTRRERRSR
jgi:hypothetical protein